MPSVHTPHSDSTLTQTLLNPRNMDRAVITYCLLICVFASVINNISSAAVEIKKSEGSESTNSTKSRKGGHRHDALVYPTEPQEDGPLNRGGSFVDATPSPCPDDALFCESADDYPKDVIKNKLKKQPKLLLDLLYEEEIDDDVHNKFGPESGSEMELCTSTAKIVYPTKGKSKEDMFEFIVNDGVHKQGIRVETCSSNGGECNNMPAHVLSLGYKSSCVQKYILRTLVVLNRNSTTDAEGFVTKPFEFPSCCSCVITMLADHNRFGAEPDTTPAVVPAQTTTARSTKETSKA